MSKSTMLNKLLQISSEALCSERPSDFAKLLDPTAGMQQIVDVLEAKNGFYAFESALLFRPLKSCGNVQGIVEWNSPNGWRNAYGNSISGIVFFAEDIFSVQFGVSSSGVLSFNPETAEVSLIAASIEEWAKTILADYENLTGWKIAHEWQQANGVLPAGKRLLPRQPFVLGGDFVIANMVALDERDAMRKLGALYTAIANLPDGAKITLHDWV